MTAAWKIRGMCAKERRCLPNRRHRKSTCSQVPGAFFASLPFLGFQHRGLVQSTTWANPTENIKFFQMAGSRVMWFGAGNWYTFSCMSIKSLLSFGRCSGQSVCLDFCLNQEAISLTQSLLFQVPSSSLHPSRWLGFYRERHWLEIWLDRWYLG